MTPTIDAATEWALRELHYAYDGYLGAPGPVARMNSESRVVITASASVRAALTAEPFTGGLAETVAARSHTNALIPAADNPVVRGADDLAAALARMTATAALVVDIRALPAECGWDICIGTGLHRSQRVLDAAYAIQMSLPRLHVSIDEPSDGRGGVVSAAQQSGCTAFQAAVSPRLLDPDRDGADDLVLSLAAVIRVLDGRAQRAAGAL